MNFTRANFWQDRPCEFCKEQTRRALAFGSRSLLHPGDETGHKMICEPCFIALGNFAAELAVKDVRIRA